MHSLRDRSRSPVFLLNPSQELDRRDETRDRNPRLLQQNELPAVRQALKRRNVSESTRNPGGFDTPSGATAWAESPGQSRHRPAVG